MTSTLKPAQQTGNATKDRGRWVFLSRSSLPSDPTARRLEKRGRWWLALSYVLCPCHLPVTLGLLGVAFGGSALGTIVAGHTTWIGIALTAGYAVVLWRGFRQLRRSKQAVANGEVLRCSPTGCDIVPIPAES